MHIATTSGQRRPRYSREIKAEAVRRVRAGESVTEVAQALIIRTTESVYSWYRTWKRAKDEQAANARAARMARRSAVANLAAPAGPLAAEEAIAAITQQANADTTATDREAQFFNAVAMELAEELRRLGGSPGAVYLKVAERPEFRSDVRIDVKIRRSTTPTY